MYSKGFGVAKDVAKAASWWLLAAEQGEAWVQVELGDLYERGEGVARDYVMAMLCNVAYASLWDDPYPG
jgi:TPR repeat protein